MTEAVTQKNTNANLIEMLDSLDGWIVEEFVSDNATVPNQAWQVVFNAELGRAGLVFIGSGSSGHTFWTDADSPEDAYNRLLDDNL